MSALGILSKIGTDMSRFRTGGRSLAFGGMCPGQNESAGKRKRDCARAPLAHPRPCAWAAKRAKNSYYRARFYRLQRRGRQKAICAVAASLLRTIYDMLKNGTFHQLLRRPPPNRKPSASPANRQARPPPVTTTSRPQQYAQRPEARWRGWKPPTGLGIFVRPANDTGGTDYTISNVLRSGSASNADLVGRIALTAGVRRSARAAFASRPWRGPGRYRLSHLPGHGSGPKRLAPPGGVNRADRRKRRMCRRGEGLLPGPRQSLRLQDRRREPDRDFRRGAERRLDRRALRRPSTPAARSLVGFCSGATRKASPPHRRRPSRTPWRAAWPRERVHGSIEMRLPSLLAHTPAVWF